MGNKGSNTTTTQQQPNPAAMSAYQNILAQAQALPANFTPYGGQLTAPVNEQQQAGISNINQYASAAQPYFSTAGGWLQSAAQPLTADQIQQYYSPFQKNVVGSTVDWLGKLNEQQQQGLLSNAANQGALGGNRVGIGQSILAGQQNAAEAPIIAGLENTGYNQAVQYAQQQFQQNPEAAAYGYANLGTGAQNAGLTGANAQIGAGTLEQQSAQAQLNAMYQQYLMKQAYPFQRLGAEAGIVGGIGSLTGGTSETTQPAPSPWGQIGGAGLAGLGALGASGAFGPAGWLASAGASLGASALSKADGGAVPHRDSGGGIQMSGAPYGGLGYVPAMQIGHGQGPPPPPKVGQPQTGMQMFQDAAKIAGSFGKWPSGTQKPVDLGHTVYENGNAGIQGVAPFAGSAQDTSMPAASDDAIRYTGGIVLPKRNRIEFREGGPVRGAMGLSSFLRPQRFADGGGDATFDERFPLTDVTPEDVPGVIKGRFAQPPLNVDDPLYGQSAEAKSYGLGSPYAPMPVRPVRTMQPTMTADDGLPPQITGVATPPPEALAFEPEDRAGASGLRPAPIPPPDDTSTSDVPAVRGVRSDRSGDFWQSLMASGLGMMASRSPHLGVAIGEGGLRGLGTYQGLQKQHFAEERENADIALQVKRLQQQAKLAAVPYEKVTANEAASLAQQKELREVPVGYRRTEKGLEPIPGGPADPTTVGSLAEAKMQGGLMNDAAIDLAVDRIKAGDRSALQNLGRGAQSGVNLTRIQNRLAERAAAENWTGADIAAANANFTSQAAAARTAAVRSANVETAIEEARQTFPLAVEASANLPRTSFVPFNKLEQLVRSGTSNPEQIKYDTAIRGAITAYSQAMSRTGVNSVHAQQAAEELINRATGHEGIVAAFDQMEKEMQAAKVAPDIVRKHILERISGRKETSEPTTATPPATTKFTPPPDWQFSPSRQQYRDPAGKMYDIKGEPI